MGDQTGSSGTSIPIALLRHSDSKQRKAAWQMWLESPNKGEGKDFEKLVFLAARYHGLKEYREDLLQDSFYALMKSVVTGKFDENTANDMKYPLLGYARAIVRNMVNNYLRGIYKSASEIEVDEEDPQNENESIGANLEDKSAMRLEESSEINAECTCALNITNKIGAKILQMEAAGLTDIEISEDLGFSQGNVRIHRLRAKKAANDRLSAFGWKQAD